MVGIPLVLTMPLSFGKMTTRFDNLDLVDKDQKVIDVQLQNYQTYFVFIRKGLEMRKGQKLAEQLLKFGDAYHAMKSVSMRHARSLPLLVRTVEQAATEIFVQFCEESFDPKWLDEIYQGW